MATDTVTIEKPATLTRTFETKDERFVITAEIKKAQIVAPYLTVDLLPADPESYSLSISGLVYRKQGGFWRCDGGGQCQDSLRAAFPHDSTVQRLCDLWDKYHLGDMNAGSREQTAIVDAWKAQGHRYDYADAVRVLRDAGKLYVPIPDQFEEIIEDGEVKRIPKMYKYGSAWLSDALPAGIAAEVVRLMTPDKPTPAPERENASKWAQYGIKMSVSYADSNPNMRDFEGDHYKCTFSRRRARMTVYYSKGYGHHGKQPTIDEVLETLAQDAATVENCGDFEQFCSDLGYSADSRSAEKTWKAMEHQAARLKNFLGDELFNRVVFNQDDEPDDDEQ